MKKIFLIISLFVYSYANADCNSSVQTAKNYVDTYIVPNGNNAITGQRANTALNYIIKALKCVDTISDLSFTRNTTRDSFIIIYKGIRFSVKDSIGTGVGASQTLSISNDTLTISGGNSVVLPVYVQVDSSTTTQYNVLNSQNAPPISPINGDTYLVGTAPTGAWVGHAKDIAEWDGSQWVFTDAVQGDYLYNTTTAITYIFRSNNWVQTTGIPALNNGNTISSGLIIGTNNSRSLEFETNNVKRGRFDSIGLLHVYNLPISTDTFITVSDINGKIGKIGKTSLLNSSSQGLQDVLNVSSTVTTSTPIVIGSNDLAITGDSLFVIFSGAEESDFSSTATGLGFAIDYENLSRGNEKACLFGDNNLQKGFVYNRDKLMQLSVDSTHGGALSINGIKTDNTAQYTVAKDTNGHIVYKGDVPIQDIVIVTESRDFQASDAGKFLLLFDSVVMTVPTPYPFKDLDHFYIYSNEGGVNAAAFYEDNTGGLPIRLIQNESLHLMSAVRGGDSILLSIGGDGYVDVGGSEYLSMNRYLYEKAEQEKVITLGTITFEDINSAPATTDIVINKSYTFPSGYYLDKLFVIQTEVFDGGLQVQEITDNNSGVTATIANEVVEKIFAPVAYDFGNSFDYHASFDNGSSEVNPQNLTTGSITIKALIKKFPN